VLWVTSGLFPGGAERNIVSVLPHLSRRGTEVALCTLTTRRDGPLAEEFARSGLRRFDLGARRLLDPAALARLVRLVRAARVDLLHAHDQDGNLIAAAAGALTGRPVVMSRHVLFEPAPTRRSRARARLVIGALTHRADLVVAVSEAVRASLVATGVPDRRIRTVPNGILQGAFTGDAATAAARAALGWDDAPVVLMPAVLRPGKGHDTLFAAAAQVRSRVPGVRFVLAGDGPERAALQAAGTPAGAEFLGHRDDVPRLMEASDVVVLPSLAEGLPTVLIEAALAARPVVASRVGGVPEIVADGSTGVLVPPGDPAALAGALVRVLTDPAGARAMGARARTDAVERFSLPHQAAALEAVYDEVLGPRGPVRPSPAPARAGRGGPTAAS
jgi:glycosyltransferase involved in cell wall biosynthesis